MPAPSPYSVHPAVAYVQAVLSNLKPTTGQDLATWMRLARAKGPKEVKELRAWLKAQGLGTNQAALVAERSLGLKAMAFDDTPVGYLKAAEGYVAQQYAGKKAALLPLYQALLSAGLAAGPDAKACPCRTFVPLFRTHVFAQLKPSTATRIDVGLALGDPRQVKGGGTRLKETGGFAKKDRITHRMEVRQAADVDAALRRWLALAYERDASTPQEGASPAVRRLPPICASLRVPKRAKKE